MALTAAQQAYYNVLASQPGQGTPEDIYNYVSSLNDYQSLASLASVQDKYNQLTPGATGFQTMNELESMYQTPITNYGDGTTRTSTLSAPAPSVPAQAAPASGGTSGSTPSNTYTDQQVAQVYAQLLQQGNSNPDILRAAYNMGIPADQIIR